jgi:hypothetical protein
MAALLKGVAQKQANRVELTSVEVLVLRDWPGRLVSLRQSPPPDPWKVRNIRWSPPKAVPIRQVLERFGTPEKDGTDEQFRRVLEWPRRGAMAYVSSDESVDLFVFEFTIGDHFCGSFWQHGRPCDPLNPAASVPKAVDPQIKESDVTQKRVSP